LLVLLCAAQGVVTANEAFQKCLIDKCLFKVNADEMDYELTACEAHQCDMSCAQETGYNVDEAKVRCRRFEASEPSCELECGANSNRLTGTLMPNEATLLPERIGDEGDEPGGEMETAAEPTVWEAREDLCGQGQCPKETILITRAEVPAAETEPQNQEDFENIYREYIDAFKNAAATVYRVDSSQILVEARLAAPPRRRRLLHTGPHVVLDLKATIRNSVVSVNSKAAKRAAEQVAETLASDATVVANNGGFALNVRVLRVTDSDFEVQEEGLDEGDEIASGKPLKARHAQKSSSNGATIVIIIGIVVLLGVLIYCVFGRKKTAAKAVPEPAANTANTNGKENKPTEQPVPPDTAGTGDVQVHVASK